MFEARLTHDNGTSYSKTFKNYESMVAWIAAQPEAGIMVWEDHQDIGAERFIQLQKDVEARQS